MSRIQVGGLLSAALIIACVLGLGVSVEKADAFEQSVQKTYNVHTMYIRQGTDPALIERQLTSNGLITINHRIEPSTIALQVGQSQIYEYNPRWDDFTFLSGNGFWDTPYGLWVNNIDYDRRVTYTGSAYTQVFEDNFENSDNWGAIRWNGVKPTVTSLTSSNPAVVSCSGMTCTANAVGAAVITASIPRTLVRGWTFVTYADGTSSWPSEHFVNEWWRPDYTFQQYYDAGATMFCPTVTNPTVNSVVGTTCTNRMYVPATTMSWTITVTAPPPPPVNGACNAQRIGEYAYNDTTWRGTGYCSAGTPITTPAFPNPGLAVTWVCRGLDGGVNSPSCPANRLSQMTASLTKSPSTTPLSLFTTVTWTAVPSGGKTPYTYLWSNDATTQSTDITYNDTGTYTTSVTIKGADNQEVTLSGDVTVEDNRVPQ